MRLKCDFEQVDTFLARQQAGQSPDNFIICMYVIRSVTTNISIRIKSVKNTSI